MMVLFSAARATALDRTWFGLSRAESVPNLTRRFESRLRSAPALAEEIEGIMEPVRSESGAGRGGSQRRRLPYDTKKGRPMNKEHL
jgi:hypothetical protein